LWVTGSPGGGDIQIVNGKLTAPSGRITIGSRAAAGEFLLDPGGQQETGGVPSSERRAMLALSADPRLDVSGDGGGA